MNDSELDSPGAIKAFLGGADKVKFSVSKENRYESIAGTLKRTGYFGLSKKEKTVIREYLSRGSGLSRAQLTRLISQYKNRRWIGKKACSKNCFPKRIAHKQGAAKWGSNFLKQVSRDMQIHFPGTKGFSVSNLERMRKFARLYPDLISAQAVRKLPWGIL